jgi:hypothetical protein
MLGRMVKDRLRQVQPQEARLDFFVVVQKPLELLRRQGF